MSNGAHFRFLFEAAAGKQLEAVLPLYGNGERAYLRVEVRKGKDIIDYEVIKATESVDDACKRIYARMRQDSIL